MGLLQLSRKKAILLTCAFCLTVVSSLATLAFGQGIVTGSIGGRVLDQSGAVIPGARVTAASQETNQAFVASTNEAGIFLLAKIPPGHYILTFDAPNFARVQARIEVEVAKQTQVSDIKMTVGNASEIVEVSGAAVPLVEASTAQITNTVDSQAVKELPIGAGLDALALYMPGVSSAGSVGRGNSNGALFSVNGQRPRSNNFELDGQSINDSSVTGPALFLENKDLIEEYQVLTHYDAQYGRNMGSQVNIITKSGANAFHGSAFENYRGSTFDSLANTTKSPIFGYCDPHLGITTKCTKPVVPQEVVNIFGGTVGGPIVRDKLWFFASALWDRDRSAGSPSSGGSQLVPTSNGVATLASSFPNSPGVGYLKIFGPAAHGPTPTFANLTTRTVSAGGVTATGVEFGTITRSYTSPSNVRQFSGRGDWQFTHKDRLMVHYFIDDEKTTNADSFATGADGYVIDLPSRGQQVGADWTRNLSSFFDNQVRFNWSRLWVFFQGGNTGCTTTAPTGCPPAITFGDGTLDNPFSGLAYGVATNDPQGRQNDYYQVQDNANKVIGRHQIKFGGEFTRQTSPNPFLPTYNGSYTYNTFNDFIANTPARVAIADGNFAGTYKEKDVGLYFQDDWRVADRLTLNLGLRWEWFQQGINLLHNLTVAQQSGSKPFWNTSLPLSRTTLPSIPENYHNFGPIVGFAWQARNRTVVRGGFRIAYDATFYNIALNSQTAAPVVNSATLTSGIDPTVPGLPTSGFTGADVRGLVLPFVPTGNISPCGAFPICDPGYRAQVRVAPNFHSPYSEQWNLGIQQEISDRIVVEVRYLGNHTLGLYQQINGNPALNALISNGFSSFIPAGLVPCTTAGQPGDVAGNNGGFVDCARRNVLLRQNSGFSIYHGLQSELRMRAFHGFSSTLAHTYSHTIDNASDVFTTTGAGMLATPQNPFNWNALERGNSNFDYRHIIGLTLIYDVPIYKGQNGLVGHLLGGWQPNVIYRYSTGQPFSPYETKSSLTGSLSLCDASSDFSSSTDACHPILNNAVAPINSVGYISALVGGVPTVKDRLTGAVVPINSEHWLYNNVNAAQFFGSPFKGIGRNTLNGQSIQAVNFAVSKHTKVTERVDFELRATAFNLLNHQYLGVPGTNIGNVATSFMNWKFNTQGGGQAAGGTAGVCSSAGYCRRLEFTGRLTF
jgi:outer membrane receptor protein involved in Fe transport